MDTSRPDQCPFVPGPSAKSLLSMATTPIGIVTNVVVSVGLFVFTTPTLIHGAPANDECGFAQFVDIGTTVAGTTDGALLDTVPGCQVNSVAPGLWYRVVGDGSKLTVDVCGQAQPVVTIFCNDCSDLGCIGGETCLCESACDPPGFSWCTEPGVEYLILVHGIYPTAVGEFELTLTSNSASCPNGVACLDPVPPPTNDECANAIDIEGSGAFPFSLLGASMTPGFDFDGEPATAIDRDVWFNWTSTKNALARLDVCGTTSSPVEVVVYDECDCLPFNAEYRSTRSPTLCGFEAFGAFETFIARAGQWFEIQLRTHEGFGGEGLLQVVYGEPKELPCNVEGTPSWSCSSPGGLDAVSSTRPNEIVAEHFRPSEARGMNGLCFWGTYFNGTIGDCRIPIPDDFEVIYYSDDCGRPGDVIAGPFSQRLGTLIVVGPVFTGRHLSGGLPEYEYSAEHNGVALNQLEDYWVEVSNDQAFDCSWYWETTGSTFGVAYMDGLFGDPPDGYSTREAINYDLSFCMHIDKVSGWPACSTPPPNDDCRDAILIDQDQERFVTVGATTDGPANDILSGTNPCDFPLADENVHNDIWYEYVAPSDGMLRVRVCDSGFDTKLAVYHNVSCPPSASDIVACNDDACGGGDPPLQSEVVLPVSLGEQFLIRVGGYRGETGAGVLTLDYAPPGGLAMYSSFSRCFTGSCRYGVCTPQLYDERDCSAVDFNADGDVDLSDYWHLWNIHFARK